MININRKAAWGVSAVLALGCAAAVLAQTRTDVTDSGSSLAAVASEVRQLRLAVEEGTRNQTQTQALGVYLSVEQSRILQLATRLDAAQKDLDASSLRLREIASSLGSVNSGVSATPEQRAHLEEVVRMLKYEQESVSLREQQARNRVNQLSQDLQQENARWNDLTSRLEQLAVAVQR